MPVGHRLRDPPVSGTPGTRRSGEEPLLGGELVSSGTLTEAQLIAPGEQWTAIVEGIDLGQITLATTA